MKILLVSNGFPPSSFGGVEVYSYDLARALIHRSHSVEVFCRETNTSIKDYEILHDTVDEIPVTRVVNDFKSIQWFTQTYENAEIDHIFQKFLDRLEPDIIHFNHLIALSSNLPSIAQRNNIPMILSLHDFWALCHRVNLIDWEQKLCPGPFQGGDCVQCVRYGPMEHSLKGSMLRIAKWVIPFQVRLRIRSVLKSRTPVIFPVSSSDFEQRYLSFSSGFEMCDVILAPSGFVRTEYEKNGYSSDRIKILPLGVSSSPKKQSIPPSTSGQIRFGFVGTIFPPKGVDILIQAFTKTAQDNIRLDLYGREDLDTIYSKHIRHIAQQDNRISFHGPFSPEQRSNIYSLIDVLVVPSRFPETFSLVAREALLANTPVIASPIGALTEIIHPNENGYLFDPGDISGLTALITKIATHPDQLSELHCPGPLHIDTVEEHITALEKIYLSVAKARVT